MKLLLAALLCSTASAALLLSGEGAQLSPVTRVVELLQSLATKVEEEAKAEEDLYERFICWGKSVVSAKEASNEAAKTRKESLEAYVQDLDAGRIELTTERVDLEKEIAGLSADIDTAEAQRAKEKADFEAAEEEMSQAVAALEKAIEVLEKSAEPEGGPGSSLLKLRVRVRSLEGFSEREADAQALQLAVRVASLELSKGDALFLQRVLTGDVPIEKDWKKLNRKATFKETYEQRSGKILRTLKSLHASFSSDLQQATDTEQKAELMHTTLMTAKGDQKSTAQAALADMAVEGAARGLSRSEATAEIEALGKQIVADEGFITDTNSATDAKKGEWKVRKQTRVDELEAINKAIAVLHSDDARDLFKRSLASQGYSFLQASSSSSDHRLAAAVAALHGTARLEALARRLSAGGSGHFSAVISAIDTMIGMLQKEEDSDLEQKEACEKARADDTREAATVSRAIDTLSDTITRLKAEIEELKQQIEEKKEEITKIEAELEDARRLREDEHAEWVKSDQDDKDAEAVVGQAIAVLEQFYGSALLQQQRRHAAAAARQRRAAQPVEVEAGQAPPPPPSTWEAPYEGKKDENTGVIAILGLIKEDIKKDYERAKAAEDAAEGAYTTFKTESEGQIGTLNTDISTMEGTISDKEGDVGAAEGERTTKQGELGVVMKRIKDTAPGCDFFTVNYEVRYKNRQIELDGLNKAKSILSGAKFEE